jgi:geranylgeranyl diphosphate synthase type II
MTSPRQGFAKLSEARLGLEQAAPDSSTKLDAIRHSVEARLRELSPSAADGGERIEHAIRYSLLDGGKRLRPLLTILTASAFDADPELALDPACAIEMVHTASLVLDDLPCMDDAVQRRGKPAPHIAHGEDIAVLSAVSLISEAFGVIGRAPGILPDVRTSIVGCLADSIGVKGLSAGQERDLHETPARTSRAALEKRHHQKTGALFVACLEAGARIAGVDEATLRAMAVFGERVGIGFQILDDLLDLAESASTGKDAHLDEGKATFATVMTVQEAEREAMTCLNRAIIELADQIGDAGPFAAFVDLVVRAYADQVSGKRSQVADALPP